MVFMELDRSCKAISCNVLIDKFLPYFSPAISLNITSTVAFILSDSLLFYLYLYSESIKQAQKCLDSLPQNFFVCTKELHRAFPLEKQNKTNKKNYVSKISL